ncbi:FtsX-like permease family protein [Streptomyces sp. NPDC091292]|uniref:FtsX-like permease family protein n=1 Tax=Streptomyces sp. NPDC091292 TaxID=3365991 RepID=UPI003802AA47
MRNPKKSPTDPSTSQGSAGVRSGRRVVVPWVRTRLRAAPGAACALALLVAVTACLAAAFPRAVDAYENAGLRRTVAEASAGSSTIQFTAPQPGLGVAQQDREKAVRDAALHRSYEGVVGGLRKPLTADPAQSSYGVRSLNALEARENWLARPNGLNPRFLFSAQEGLDTHGELRDGRLPRAGTEITAESREVEAAVTAETADRLKIKTGSVVHVPGVQRADLAVRITGILEPERPKEAYWGAQPIIRRPALVPVAPDDPSSPRYWLGTLLLAPDAAPALLGTAASPERFWHIAPDPEALTAHDLTGLKAAVSATVDGAELLKIRQVTDINTAAGTDLDDLLDSYGRLQAGIAPVVAVAAFGAAAVAGVVLLMAGGLTAGRRRAELAVLRARGGSLGGIGLRLLGETAVVAVPAGALGLAVALLAVPEGRMSYAVLGAGVVTLLACAVLPVRAMAVHRAVRVHTARDDVTHARPSRRRTVAELTLLVLAVSAVAALRRQGTSDGGELVALAPVLVGVIAALVLVRVYPLPLRWLARPAGRLRGVIGHLSLARAGRGSASAVLPLLALLTALTTAAFGGSVLAGVEDARDRAAVLETGADARVEAPGLPFAATAAARVAKVPGVREVTRAEIDSNAQPVKSDAKLPLVTVDAAAYAGLAGRMDLGGFPGGLLTAGAEGTAGAAGAADAGRGSGQAGAGDIVPAVASPATAERLGTEPFALLAGGKEITVRIVAQRSLTPAVSGAEFLVVDARALGREMRPTMLLVNGDGLDADTLAKAAGATANVHLRQDARDRYADSPTQTGAERVYVAAVAASAGYAALALLLALARAAPERAALLARLRTMGLTRRDGRRLLVLESLPQALPAAIGGALTGWAAIRLLAPGTDLTAVALATASATNSPPAGISTLRPDLFSLLLPAVGVVLLTVGVAVAQAWWTGRRGAVRELRVGDQR